MRRGIQDFKLRQEREEEEKLRERQKTLHQRKDSYVMIEDFSIREEEDLKSEDLGYSKIDVPELGRRGEVCCEQELRKRPPSSSARWYYDEEDMILNHDIGDFPRAVLVIVTLRLGLNEIDPDYFEAVKACFDLP